MTKAETNNILAMIAEMYPAFLKDRNPNMTSQIWHKVTENLPYEAMKTALMEFFATDTKGFAPSPGMLREIILSHMAQEEMTEMEAWNLVSRAIRKSTKRRTTFRPPPAEPIHPPTNTSKNKTYRSKSGQYQKPAEAKPLVDKNEIAWKKP